MDAERAGVFKMSPSRRLAVCTLLQIPLLPQQSEDAPRTGGLLNGRAWNKWDYLGRMTYLNGYSEGIAMIGDSAVGFFPRRWTLGQTTEALDSFYKVVENRPIPISAALIIHAMKAVGMDQGDIDAQILDQRRKAATGRTNSNGMK